MKGGAENRKKTIMAGALGAVALCCVIYGYNALYGGSGPPPATSTPAPVTSTAAGTTSSTRRASNNSSGGNSANQLGLGAAAGVAAQKMASTSASLDPTLDESAMLRTESLVYSGTGRNIFSATYVPPVALPSHVPNPRANGGAAAAPKPFVPTGPPPPPPIDLKFFGTAIRANGQRQIFLLQGDNVYLAEQGDIVARKYKIVGISSNSIQVEDLVNNDTQTLPLQMN
jgi:hypothetical protein